MAGAGEADSGSARPPTTRSTTATASAESEVEAAVSASTVEASVEASVYRCEQCDNFEATTQSALLTHVAQCHTTREAEPEKVENNNPPADRPHRKLFECDVCNMKFSNGANMRRHRMRHTGVKPYECRVCQKRFFRKDHLAEHFTTHTKTLPYHCPICNRGFQRQIAMRAHFQNEHVGQHDLVKSCPLCSYRAGSMKSLRVHFSNKHGIDLDNPGPGSQASLLAAAAAAGHLAPLDGTISALTGLSVSISNYSDSGDSNGARSTDNATPPMHFLTPHVEISMADAPASYSPPQCDQPGSYFQTNNNNNNNEATQQRVNGECPNSPQSADSNSNAPTSSHAHSNSHIGGLAETSITPSISLIPIKQEPQSDENINYDTTKLRGITLNGPVNTSTASVTLQSATSSSLSSLIKVSPLKSLLREDLKRKMATRGSASRARATISPNPGNSESNSADPSSATNGTITSTGPEQPSDSTVWRTLAKRGLHGLQCTFCGIGFPDQTLYFLHKGCHSDANPWKCNICGEQCSNVYEFNSHLLSKSHQ